MNRRVTEQSVGTDLVKRMTALWDDVRFLAGETEGEAEGLETDRALCLVLCRVVAGDDG